MLTAIILRAASRARGLSNHWRTVSPLQLGASIHATFHVCDTSKWDVPLHNGPESYKSMITILRATPLSGSQKNRPHVDPIVASAGLSAKVYNVSKNTYVI